MSFLQENRNSSIEKACVLQGVKAISYFLHQPSMANQMCSLYSKSTKKERSVKRRKRGVIVAAAMARMNKEAVVKQCKEILKMGIVFVS